MLGGAAGAGCRYYVSAVALEQMGPDFPWGTWIVNLVGGLLMGVLAGFMARGTFNDENIYLLLGTGMLGGFTTFSAFSLETYNMLARGDYAMGLGYALSSVAGSIMFLAIGLWLTRTIG